MRSLFISAIIAFFGCACGAAAPPVRFATSPARPAVQTRTFTELGISLALEEGRWTVSRGCTSIVDGDIVLTNSRGDIGIGIRAVPWTGGLSAMSTRLRETLGDDASTFGAAYATDQFGGRVVTRFRQNVGGEVHDGRAAALVLDGREGALLVIGRWPEFQDRSATTAFNDVLDGIRAL